MQGSEVRSQLLAAQQQLLKAVRWHCQPRLLALCQAVTYVCKMCSLLQLLMYLNCHKTRAGKLV